MIIGSCWPEDAEKVSDALKLISPQLKKNLQLVILPHEVRDPHQVALIKRSLPEARVVATDGILLEAYKDFDVAMIGGGWKTGLHNVLEPTLWGLPTLCGPDTRKQPDARYLKDWGALKVCESQEQLSSALHSLLTADASFQSWKRSAGEAQAKIQEHKGANFRLAKILSQSI
jgi:3-deoxy-D-manno-octulosonic-acid transferase